MSKHTDMREISNAIAKKLIEDEKFRVQFVKDPEGTLKSEGVPADMVPSKIDVDLIELGRALERATTVRFRIGERNLRDDRFAPPGSVGLVVACVVV